MDGTTRVRPTSREAGVSAIAAADRQTGRGYRRLQEVSDGVVTHHDAEQAQLAIDRLARSILQSGRWRLRHLRYTMAVVLACNADIGRARCSSDSAPRARGWWRDRSISAALTATSSSSTTRRRTWRRATRGPSRTRLRSRSRHRYLPVSRPSRVVRPRLCIDRRDLDGHQFRFFNTHLEVADFAEVHVKQALELLARVLLTRAPVVVAGDVNSPPPRGRRNRKGATRRRTTC